MKAKLFLSIWFLFNLHSFGQAPKNLTECNTYFDKKLHPKDIRQIKNLSEDGLVSLHMSMGMSIRNSWIHGNRNPELISYFSMMDIHHPDDISTIIIKNYWHYLNKTMFDLTSEIAHYHEYWKRSYEESKRMQEKTTIIEQKFAENYVNIKYNNKSPFTLKLPDYKNDSWVFSNEFIKYKNGYIINSLTTSPGTKTEISYRYFYINLKTNQLVKLKFKAFDSVQSVININSTLYIAGKKNNKLKITSQTGEKVTPLSLSISKEKNLTLLNNWIKLGARNDTLFALQPNGLFFYNGKNWEHKEQFDFENIFKKHFETTPLIPTENIKITSQKLYFLQEVLQMRNCSLLEFDFRKKELSEFWEKHNLSDNYHQEISTYTTINDSTLMLASERAGNNILLSEKDIDLKIYLHNGKVKSDTINNLNIRKVLTTNDGLLLIGENGLFDLKNNEITRLTTFENTEQTINNGKSRSHFKFYPRSCEIIAEEEYLIGGMFGGLYRLNLKNKTILCLDDNYPLQTIEILNLEKQKNRQDFSRRFLK